MRMTSALLDWRPVDESGDDRVCTCDDRDDRHRRTLGYDQKSEKPLSGDAWYTLTGFGSGRN